jgi:hypothetical protein
MRAWYDAIPDKRALFFADFLPASNAAEVVAYVFGGANTAEELIAKFPLPAEDGRRADRQGLLQPVLQRALSARGRRCPRAPRGRGQGTD